MEIDGHPTQDLLEELERRGAIRVVGTSAGPRVEAIRFLTERIGDADGFWLFVPGGAFLTGLDDPLI